MGRRKLTIISLLLCLVMLYNQVFSYVDPTPTTLINGDVIYDWDNEKKEYYERDKSVKGKQGWVLVANDGWHFTDKNGQYVKNVKLKKDDLEFYLDDKGNVAIEQLINIDDDIYYCNYFGAIAKNCWVKIPASMVENQLDTHPDYYHYYFDEFGKAVRGIDEKPKFFSVDGLTYLFNSEGQMLSGWITDKGEIIDIHDTDRPFEEATYFTTDYGNLASGWVSYENPYTDREDMMSQSTLWFYFDPKTFKKRGNGKDQTCSIGPSSYVFSDKGYLYSGFTYYNSDNENNNQIYTGDEKNGFSQYSARWAYTVPPENENYSKDEKEKKNWMYIQKGGIPVKNKKFKINNKYYAFDENGIMQTGLNVFLNGEFVFNIDMDKTSGEDIIKKAKYTYTKNGETYYFYDLLTKMEMFNDLFYNDYHEGIYDDSSGTPVKSHYYPTMDPEVNERRDWIFSGRRTHDLDPYSPYYLTPIDDFPYYFIPGSPEGFQYFLFDDSGAMVEKETTIHMMDKDYTFLPNRSGTLSGEKNGKYYYDGFLLQADPEIGYGLMVIKKAFRQNKQKFLYWYGTAPLSYSVENTFLVDDSGNIIEEEYECRPREYDIYFNVGIVNDETPYKVLDSKGKLVKSKKEAYKDKQGRYWYIGEGDYFYGIFSTPIKKTTTKVKLKTPISRDACPDVLLNGTKEEKINYFKYVTNPTGEPKDGTFLADALFDEDFKNYFVFIQSGTIKDVTYEADKTNPSELIFTLTFDGVHFKSDRNEKYTFIPFGMNDDGNMTATFFPNANDFEMAPDDNEFFVNANWDDKDSIDTFDENGDGIYDYRILPHH